MLHGELCNDLPCLFAACSSSSTARGVQTRTLPSNLQHFEATDGHRHNLTGQTYSKESRYPSHFKQPECTVLKTSPAIWFRKMCRSHHLPPKYINITTVGNNQQTTNTKIMATTYRTHQKLAFLYVTKQKLNLLTPNDPYRGRTAPLISKRCILCIYSTNIGTEYFKHGIYAPFFPLRNAICFIILTYLVPVLFTFYIQVC